MRRTYKVKTMVKVSYIKVLREPWQLIERLRSFSIRKIKLSVKAAQIDEEKSLIAKFGEGATKSGATLKGIFEKAIGGKKKKKEEEEK